MRSVICALTVCVATSCSKPAQVSFQQDSETPESSIDAGVDAEAGVEAGVEAEAKKDEEDPPMLSMYGSTFVPIDGRETNIKIAAEKIDGRVIQSGSVFSFNDAVGIRSAENGYVDAPVLLQGRRTKDLGGGVCQVSSTLHAAAIEGGLIVVERRPHSLVPKYVDPGFDATVTFPASCAVQNAPCEKIDLKIRNPYPVPLTIKTDIVVEVIPLPESVKKHLVIWFEGMEPVFKTVIRRQREPMGRGTRRQVRSNRILSPTYVKVVQSADEGYFVRSTAVYLADGAIDHEFKWFSRYPPVDEVWEVGWNRPASAGDPWDSSPAATAD